MEKKYEERKKRAIEDNGAPLEAKRISIKQVLSELRDLHNDVSEMKAQLSLHQEKIKKLEAQFKPPQRKIPPPPATPSSASLDIVEWDAPYCSICNTFGHDERKHELQ